MSALQLPPPSVLKLMCPCVMRYTDGVNQSSLLVSRFDFPKSMSKLELRSMVPSTRVLFLVRKLTILILYKLSLCIHHSYNCLCIFPHYPMPKYKSILSYHVPIFRFLTPAGHMISLISGQGVQFFVTKKPDSPSLYDPSVLKSGQEIMRNFAFFSIAKFPI